MGANGAEGVLRVATGACRGGATRLHLRCPRVAFLLATSFAAPHRTTKMKLRSVPRSTLWARVMRSTSSVSCTHFSLRKKDGWRQGQSAAGDSDLVTMTGEAKRSRRQTDNDGRWQPTRIAYTLAHLSDRSPMLSS